MEILLCLIVVWCGYIIGDGLSTFFWHVPQHVFGKLHVSTHHSKNQDFYHYAVLSPKPLVMLDGFLGYIPYLPLVPIAWLISKPAVIVGLAIAPFHSWWRHTYALGWKTPEAIARLCSILCIVTPEQHQFHHQRAHYALGDIFTFYDRPARYWLQTLLLWKRKLKHKQRQLTLGNLKVE